jgi:hypothetical protein
MNRIRAIAWNTFREAVRNKILYSLLFFAVLIILSALAIGNLTLHEEVRTIRDVGLFGIDIFGVIIAIFVGVNLLYKELDLKTVYTILPKPLWRWEFVLGKWLGMLLTLAVQMAVMGAVLALVLASEGASFDVPMVKAVWLLFVNVMVVTSIAVFLLGLFQPVSVRLLRPRLFRGRPLGARHPRARRESWGQAPRPSSIFFCNLMPNLHLFYPSGAIVGAEDLSVHRQFVGADYILSATGYGIAYSLVVLVLGHADLPQAGFRVMRGPAPGGHRPPGCHAALAVIVVRLLVDARTAYRNGAAAEAARRSQRGHSLLPRRRAALRARQSVHAQRARPTGRHRDCLVTKGDYATARAAFEAERAALLGTRSFYTPYAERLPSLERRISRLLAAAEDRASPATFEERAKWHAERLAERPRPKTSMVLLALLGLATWVTSA